MTIRGYNALALQHKRFPYEKLFRYMKTAGGGSPIKDPGLSFLWSTFGTNKEPIRRFLEEFPSGTLQIYLTNEVARRKVMYKGELGRKWSVSRYNDLLERNALRAQLRIRARVRNILRSIQPYRGIQRIILCTGLEDQFTDKAVKNLLKIIKKDWPYDISRNPVDIRKTHLMFGPNRLDFVELHSCKPKITARGMFSNDGCDIDHGQHRPLGNHIRATDLRNHFRTTQERPRAVFLWFAEWQGLHGDSHYAPRPRTRDINVSTESLRVGKRILEAV